MANYVPTIISGVASLSVLIGLITGIFFLVLTALKWVSKIRESIYEEELIRQKRFLMQTSQFVGVDSLKYSDTSGTGSALENLKNRVNLKETESFLKSNTNKIELQNENQNEQLTKNNHEPDPNTVKIRELIEKTVETIIGGPLDGTTVGQLSTHSTYLELFTKYHNLLCEEIARLGFALHVSVSRQSELEQDTSSVEKSNIKRIIKQIINEAATLPKIQEIGCKSKTSKVTLSEDFTSKSYEDVLATAILNKVVEKFQNSNYSEKNGNIDRRSKLRSRNKKLRKNLEDRVLSDDDWSDTSRSEQLSLTIEEYIEEVTTALEASDDEESDFSEEFETKNNRGIPFPESGRIVIDDIDNEKSDVEEENAATELITSTSSWEENWLFQKKRLRSTPNAHHPVPVPMLVPNPSEDFRALVGGVDADDLSDMSDCNDTTLEDLIITEEKSELFLNAKEENKFCYVTEVKADSVEVKAEKEKESNNQNKSLECRNSNKENSDYDDIVNNQNYEALENNEANTNEPTSVLPDELFQKDRDSSIQNFYNQYETKRPHSSSESSENNVAGKDENVIRCSTALKEKEKWMNPVFLLENPYSLENIEKRQKKKNEYFRIRTYSEESIQFTNDLSSDELSNKGTEKSRFSRDYYVNESKYPSGKCSPSFRQRPEGSNQKLKESPPLEDCELRFQKMESKNSLEKIIIPTNDKGQFGLPSVKELAKQFTQENMEFQRSNENSRKLESKHKSFAVNNNAPLEKETELDYSTVPVSQIIVNLQKGEKKKNLENRQNNVVYSQLEPAIGIKVLRRNISNTIIENHTEKDTKPEKGESIWFNGKEVHSLTARSISKEFRDGLKSNSYKSISKNDQVSSDGESIHENIINHQMKTSPLPPFDLKNMKKFWEQIIIANSNSTKQK